MTTATKRPVPFRASAKQPCPVCGSGTKACSATDDGMHMCRGEPRPGWVRLAERPDAAGFSHYRAHTGPGWDERARGYAGALTDARRGELARALGLPRDALAALPLLGSHRDNHGPHWTFPEVDAALGVVGVVRRYADGGKKAASGANRGLTVPAGWPGSGPVLVPEGASDVLALHLCGVTAVGRPSNTGGAELLGRLLADLDPERRVYVLGENDAKPDGTWRGREGVASVAPRVAAALGRPVWVAYPPNGVKDCRVWVQSLLADQGECEDRELIGREVLAHVEATAECVAPGATLLDAAAGRPAAAPTAWSVRPSTPTPRDGVTASHLVTLEFPPPRFAVGGMLPEGLTVLGGKPKARKSWLALLMAWAVAGGHELDGRPVRRGDVLYLALEDNNRRLKERLLMLGRGVGWPVPPGLHLYTKWPRAADGGLYHIAEWLSERKGAAGMVVIDVLAKFRKPPRSSGNTYAEDYEALGSIQEMLGAYAVPGLVLHHTRKLAAEDPFDELSGSIAISGAADTLMVLDRDGERGTLFTKGRDVADTTTPLTGDPATLRWTIGASRDGIDTTGRGAADPAAGKLEKCKAWLLEFLRVYAHPSAEIEAAAKTAGFSTWLLRDAKAALGEKGTGELVHRNFGSSGDNDWWSGVGPVSTWKRRPPAWKEPRIAHLDRESRESDDDPSDPIPD